MKDWLIIRTSPKSTVTLAKSLREAGYDCWTPVKKIERRLPRSKGKKEIEVPILPTFVFAREKHEDELLALSKRTQTRHAGFSVFHYFGSIPKIHEGELRTLRMEERRANGKVAGRVITQGERVRVPDGPFAGMSGIVETAQGKFALVCFPGLAIPVRIATFRLDSDEVTKSEQPIIGAAA